MKMAKHVFSFFMMIILGVSHGFGMKKVPNFSISPEECSPKKDIDEIISDNLDKQKSEEEIPSQAYIEEVIEKHSRPLRCMEVLNDNKFVTCADDSKIKLWDVNGVCLKSLRVTDLGGDSLATWNSNNVVYASDQGHVCVWNIESSSDDDPVTYFKVSKDARVTVLANTNDKKAIGLSNGKVCFLCSDKGKMTCRNILIADKEAITAVEGLPGEKMLFGTEKGSVVVWDAKNDKPIYTFDCSKFKKPIAAISVLGGNCALAFLKNSRTILHFDTEKLKMCSFKFDKKHNISAIVGISETECFVGLENGEIWRFDLANNKSCCVERKDHGIVSLRVKNNELFSATSDGIIDWWKIVDLPLKDVFEQDFLFEEMFD